MDAHNENLKQHSHLFPLQILHGFHREMENEPKACRWMYREHVHTDSTRIPRERAAKKKLDFPQSPMEEKMRI